MSKLFKLRQELIIGEGSQVFADIQIKKYYAEFMEKYRVLFEKYADILERYSPSSNPKFASPDVSHLYIQCPLCKHAPLAYQTSGNKYYLRCCAPIIKSHVCKYKINITAKHIKLLHDYFARRQRIKWKSPAISMFTSFSNRMKKQIPHFTQLEHSNTWAPQYSINKTYEYKNDPQFLARLGISDLMLNNGDTE